jgi:hypothetical protein
MAATPRPMPVEPTINSSGGIPRALFSSMILKAIWYSAGVIGIVGGNGKREHFVAFNDEFPRNIVASFKRAVDARIPSTESRVKRRKSGVGLRPLHSFKTVEPGESRFGQNGV